MSKRSDTKFWIMSLLLILLTGNGSYLGADVYRWTDSKGNVHYGNRPPTDGPNVELLFKEIPTDSADSQQALEAEQRRTEAVLKELDEKSQREVQARQQDQAAIPNTPTRQELIDREKAALEKKIAELEALPLDYFGSQKNKRVQIGYYRYRLETLTSSPDDYFNSPEPFEGNIKPPPKKQ